MKINLIELRKALELFKAYVEREKADPDSEMGLDRGDIRSIRDTLYLIDEFSCKVDVTFNIKEEKNGSDAEKIRILKDPRG